MTRQLAPATEHVTLATEQLAEAILHFLRRFHRPAGDFANGAAILFERPCLLSFTARVFARAEPKPDAIGPLRIVSGLGNAAGATGENCRESNDGLSVKRLPFRRSAKRKRVSAQHQEKTAATAEICLKEFCCTQTIV